MWHIENGRESYGEAEMEEERSVLIEWGCDQCGYMRNDYIGGNEGGSCVCGGEYEENARIYDA